MKFYKHNFEVSCPEWFNKGNVNNSLFHIGLSYGHANGYERRFEFNFFHLSKWNFYSEKFIHNGHARYAFSCGLFSFFFDWTNKKSIVLLTARKISYTLIYMKQIVLIKLIVDDNNDNAAEIARANMFQSAVDLGYNVLHSETRLLDRQEIKDAKAACLWD